MKTYYLSIFTIFLLYSCAQKIISVASKKSKEITLVDTNAAASTIAKSNTTSVISITRDTTSKIASIDNGKTIVALDDAKLLSGKILLQTKCVVCHDAKEPSTYNAAQWSKIVDWMAPRATLSTKEKTDLLVYVTAFAKK